MAIILGSECSVPAQIPGLVLWLDGQDPNGNRNSPSGGSAVATWIDKSGRGNHVTQAVGAQQPVFTTNSINGKPAMVFSQGSTTYYQRAAIKDFYSINSYSIFAVVRPTAFVSNNVIIEGGGSGTTGLYVQLSNTTAIRLIHRSPFAGSGGDSVISAVNAVSANNNFIVQFHRSASNNNQIVTSSNGVTAALTPLTQPAYPTSDMRLTIGTNSNGTGTNTFTGSMGEICAYVGEPSAAKTAAILSYLSSRWGI